MVSELPSQARLAARLVLIGVVAVSLALLIDVRILPSDPAFGLAASSYRWLVVAHVAAGLALLAAGILAVASGVLLRLGVLATLAGLAWLGPDLSGRAISSLVIGGAGAASSLMTLPLLFHLTVAATWSGEVSGRWRWAIGVAYAAVGLVAIGRLVTFAPFHELGCTWEECSSMASILSADVQGRGAVRVAMAGVSLGIGVAMAGVAAWGIVRNPRPSLGHAILGGGGMVAGSALAIGAGLELARRLGLLGVRRSSFEEPVLLAWSIGAVLIGVGLALLWWQATAARRRIRRIADGVEAAPAPGALVPALAVALADPGLRIGYRTADGGSMAATGYVDADGEPFDPTAAAGQAITPVTRDGSIIAIVVHDPVIDQPLLSNELPTSMVVALDNERLRAIRLAQLRELRASRARIVEVGDAERRRIERDLHDGAQQRLLAIAFDLRLARARAEREGRDEPGAQLAKAEELALGAIDELRRLCRGIHPQVLSQAGLTPALEALANEAAIPLEVRSAEWERAPAGVETAAYELVVEAIGQATSRASPALVVDIARGEGVLTVVASDGGPEPLDVPVRLSDRVGAAGGEVHAGTAGGRAFLRADLPCPVALPT